MKAPKRAHIKALIMEQLALLSFELIVVILLCLIAFFTFYKLSSLLIANEIEVFDDKAYFIIRYFASPFLDKFMLSVTFLGNRQFVIFPVTGLIIYYLFIKKHRGYSIKIPVVALGSAILNLLLKTFYDRARPALHHMVEVHSLSFPSGHAMFSMSFYGLLIYIVIREIKNKILRVSLSILIGMLILFIGVSRVYLGVHYTSDVVAGFSAGFLWLVAALWTTGMIETKAKKKLQKTSLSEKTEREAE